MDIIDVIDVDGREVTARIIVRLFDGYKPENDHLWTNQLGNRTSFPFSKEQILSQVNESLNSNENVPRASTITFDFKCGGSPLAHPSIRNDWADLTKQIADAARDASESVTAIKFHMELVGTNVYEYGPDGEVVGGIECIPREGFIPEITFLTLASTNEVRDLWIPDAAPIGDFLNLLSDHKLHGGEVSLAIPMILGHADDMNDFSRVLSQAKAVGITSVCIRDFHSHDESFWRSIDDIDKHGAHAYAVSRGFKSCIEGVTTSA